MAYEILDTINSSRDVTALSEDRLPQLCSEVREFIIEHVSRTGGHLSANLGTVELITGMHHCFSTPEDQFVFDVGHQSYTHKIYTGRKDGFDRLRMFDGLSGFPSPAESCEDSFVAGHGSNSISVAIGLAYAKKLKREPGNVVALIGDGSFTGGMAYEGLNNVGPELDNLIILLNDNKMSISKNVGAIPKYLSRLRTESGYLDAKKTVSDTLLKIPVIGKGIHNVITGSKSLLRRSLYRGGTFFEDLGFTYYQILDGNNIEEVCSVLSAAKRIQGPVFIHAFTVKGKGFAPAEQNPGEFHGVSAFDTANPPDPDDAPKDSFSNVFGKTLSEIANTDDRICAITAAMKYGTGLQFFYHDHKQRFFDVGMAEEHAVTFRGGLAKSGMKPVVALYSTFMQRANDQYLNDVMLLDLDVMFRIDRAGIVPGDGETHQGVFDMATFSNYDNTVIVCPSNYDELICWEKKLLSEIKGPKVLRYPRGGQNEYIAEYKCTGRDYDLISCGEEAKALIVCYGRNFANCLKAQKSLMGKGKMADVLKLNVVAPVNEEAIDLMMGYENVFFFEEHVKNGSASAKVAVRLLEKAFAGKYFMRCIENYVLRHGKVEELEKLCGLDAVSIEETVGEKL